MPSSFKGKLVTETMLVRGLNDKSDQFREVAVFLEQLQPVKAYLSVPTRPPAERWAEPPHEAVVNQAYQIFSEHLDRVECLTGHETTDFSFTGDPAEDILSITAVDPMRHGLRRKSCSKGGLTFLSGSVIKKREAMKLYYRGTNFDMVRKLPGR